MDVILSAYFALCFFFTCVGLVVIFEPEAVRVHVCLFNTTDVSSEPLFLIEGLVLFFPGGPGIGQQGQVVAVAGRFDRCIWKNHKDVL